MHTPSKRKAGPPDSPKRKKARTAEPERAEFQIVRSSLVLTIPPVFAANCRTGAEEMLDSMIMRYQPALGGVVLAHTNLQFLDRAGRIKAESPFASLNVGFDATVWRPEIGMKLKGNVSLCSPDHISLLVHRTFNVSIPRHHIPADEWEFEYGAAENDPEFGTVLEGEIEGEGQVESADRGRWIHRVTAEPVGGKRGRVEFTVVGLTIANQMLSLIGSMQLDPFSPDHVPQAARARPAAVRDESEGEREDKDEDESDRSKVETEEVKAEREKREMKRKRNDEKSGKAERKTPKRKKSS